MSRWRHAVPTVLRVGGPAAGTLVLTAALIGLRPSVGVGPLADGVPAPVAVAGVCWAGQLWYLGRLLDAERRWLPGPADVVTLLRGALYAVVAGFVVVRPAPPLSWVPALLYGTATLLDCVDGTIARTVGTETDVGGRLDVALDAVGTVVAPLVAVAWGQLPIWYLSLSAARYVYVGGLVWRRRRRPLFETPDDDLSRYLGAAQMVFITAALVPATPAVLVEVVAPPLLVASLVSFARDFLAVTGRETVLPGRRRP